MLFVAAEGANEIPIRLKGVVEQKLRPDAIARRYWDNRSTVGDLDELPFAWIEDCPNLQDKDDFDRLMATAKQAARNIREQFDLPLALIVIDTLNATANFKDGNDAAEGQRVMNRLGGAEPANRRLRAGRRSLRQDGGNRHPRHVRQGSRRRRRAGAAGRPGDQRHHQQHPHGGAKAPRRQGRHRNAVRPESGRCGRRPDDMRRRMEGEPSCDTRPLPRPRTRWPKSLRIFKTAVETAVIEHGKAMRPYGSEDPTVRAVSPMTTSAPSS